MDGDRSEVQRLYDAVFSLSPRRGGGGGGGGLPTLTHIRWLQDILDGMKAADVGIDAGAGDGERSSSSSAFSSSDDERSPRGRRFIPAPALFTRITYVHIHECDDFSIGVFCFPAGATLPLHDHPQMVVLSKLLYGSMRVSSYDWVTAPCSGGPTKGGLAKVVAVDELREAPCKASVLFPRSGGNIHTLTAVTPCALLDVLAPPYAEDLGRPSTYISDTPIPSLPGFAVLEEARLPEDFRVVGAPYVGPELVVDMDLYDDD
ncbi:hypothetical protein BDA96_02G245300 [Sorghum bicolor]|uniref:cysteine dioxygenase n=2 Tax=Sorghum bicolor TaxID=4558 RepID=A0A921RRJ3_SORBI|nr:plant cysteine oxidase 1 [Sorghum bicolor]EER96903.1 hypothetical protein SORBI_3002G234100 [Sorghum bicolor]KAG0544095.1 hypothetical protein BDA96_02G245300 [Sorghum bicolor]|eukprot:XP_002460382.1 plant cysteine oxidase 1 [Sorghum bicolor]